MKIPKFDYNGKSFGEMIRDVEKAGALGHFKDFDSLRCDLSLDGYGFFSTRVFWNVAGVDQEPLFVKYLGENKTINNIEDSQRYIKPILDNLTTEIMTIIQTANTDLIIKKLLYLLDKTSIFYYTDRITREKITTNITLGDSSIPFEENRNITISIINALNIFIENTIVFQKTGNKVDVSEEELFDGDLLIKIFLYGLLSQYYTLLNLSKNAMRNYQYCSGIVINCSDSFPINGIVHHPPIYTSTLISGNQNALMAKGDNEYFKNIDSTVIGNAFVNTYGISFLQLIACLQILEKYCEDGCLLTKKDDLNTFLTKNIKGLKPDLFIHNFSVNKCNLSCYITKRELFIYKMGCNKYRLDIRPLIMLDNDWIYIPKTAIKRAKNIWASYATNGGKPYTDVGEGQGDIIIDAFGKREEELGEILIQHLLKILENHYPNSKYKDYDVKYYRIFGRKDGHSDTEDFDIVYYVNDELFLIESKYFSDSPTPNQAVGDFNKMYKDGKYYEHCRSRYDLVLSEPEKLKTFLNTNEPIRAHLLFVSSKPLEIDFQDIDGVVTFLSVANFANYLLGKLEAEDGSVLRPTHML